MTQQESDESIVEQLGCDILGSEGMKTEKTIPHHGSTSVYMHSLAVAVMCVKIARLFSINVDMRSLVRGALLHDYFLYDWHRHDKLRELHATGHAKRALENAKRDFSVGKIETNMILSHMFPLNLVLPKYRESVILCTADKICAVRETLINRNSRRKKEYKK